MKRRRLKEWQWDMRQIKKDLLQNAVFERDEWQCRAIGHAGDGKDYRYGGPRCPAKRQLERHHLLNRSQGGTDEHSNLLTVCHHHHVKITQRRATYYRTDDGRIVLAWREKDGEDLRFDGTDGSPEALAKARERDEQQRRLREARGRLAKGHGL